MKLSDGSMEAWAEPQWAMLSEEGIRVIRRTKSDGWLELSQRMKLNDGVLV